MTGTATGEREVIKKSLNVRSDQLTDDLRELTYRDEVTSDLQFSSVLLSGVCARVFGPSGVL